MKKLVCTICSYIYEGTAAPENCPQCKAPAAKFQEQGAGELAWADTKTNLQRRLDAENGA